MSHNPYTNTTDVYSKNAKAATTDQRSLEGQILMKAAKQLEVMKHRIDTEEVVPLNELEDVLSYNRKLWTVFAGETVNDDHQLPQELKNNIASLSVFVFKQTVDIMAAPKPEKFDALIEINRNIASGLLKSLKNTQDTKKESEKESTIEENINTEPKNFEIQATDMQT